MYKIAIIFRDKNILNFLASLLKIEQYYVFLYNSISAIDSFNNNIDAIIIDFEILNSLSERDTIIRDFKIKKIPIIIITTQDNLKFPEENFQNNEFRFLIKPFAKERFLKIVKNTCKKIFSNKRDILKIDFSPSEIVYKSKIMEKIISLSKKIASSDSIVLITGESGTGKELIARLIHFYSNRKYKVFFPINCAALTDSLFESQLFGYVKGAFTGAIQSNKGILKEIEGGTLFLDEICEIPLSIQAKFLRLIQYKEFIPIGSNKIEKVDLRFIVATNKNLNEEVKKGKFRNDLFYRINVITINIPPLRDRKEDIEILIEHFIKKFNKKFNKNIKGIDKNLLEILKKYSWPGNIRELKNLIERGILISNQEYLSQEHFPENLFISMEEKNETILLSLNEVMKNYIKRIYFLTGKNKLKTAKILKISRKTLDRKLKEMEILQ